LAVANVEGGRQSAFKTTEKDKITAGTKRLLDGQMAGVGGVKRGW